MKRMCYKIFLALSCNISIVSVFVIGEIDGAHADWPIEELSCTWTLVYGQSWWLVDGESKGSTHMSLVGMKSGERFCAWAEPIDCHIACRSLNGMVVDLIFDIYRYRIFQVGPALTLKSVAESHMAKRC